MSLPVYPALYNIRLATSSGGLTKGFLLYNWEIPAPVLPIYQNHSQRVPTSDGGEALRGFPFFSLTWNRLSGYQAYTLRQLVEAALDSAGGLIYATIDYGWSGVDAPGHWVNVSGVPVLPVFAPAGGTLGGAIDNVTLTVNNLTVVNDPATGL